MALESHMRGRLRFGACSSVTVPHGACRLWIVSVGECVAFLVAEAELEPGGGSALDLCDSQHDEHSDGDASRGDPSVDDGIDLTALLRGCLWLA